MTADDALFGTTTRAILRLLFAPASRGYHLREIARCCGLGLGQLQRELTRLCACGILERSISGNRHRFRANRDSPLFEDIAHLVATTFGMAHDLRCALAPVLGRIDLALIHGPAACAEYASLPCIDLLIVGGLEDDALESCIKAGESLLRIEIHATCLAAREFRARRGERGLEAILESRTIVVVGALRKPRYRRGAGAYVRTPVDGPYVSSQRTDAARSPPPAFVRGRACPSAATDAARRHRSA